ncbi:MAG: 50S ribosomal protein L28 [Candidatus Omnitrophota bacterium]
MSLVCAICNKGPLSGRAIKRRGMAKAKGGAGQKITGRTLRRFLPNLQKVKVILNGVKKTVYVCTRCIKKGKIQKA